MIQLDLSILNQKGTPMFNSDLLANRPSPAVVGRIFIATDSPFGLFRDTGSVWDQIASAGGADTNIYNTSGTLTGNRVVGSGGFSLTFNPSTTFASTLTAPTASGAFAAIGLNTLSYAAAFSSSNLGNVYAAIGGINLQTFAGSATFANSNLAAANVSVNSIDFSSAGSTLTMTQATGLRVMAGHQNQFQYQGTNSGTITHAATSQNLGFYRPPGATGILTITNAYGQLINDLNDYGSGFAFTNRFGIFQAGASDKNVFFGNLLIGSLSDTGEKLQITGNILVNSSINSGLFQSAIFNNTSATANRVIINHSSNTGFGLSIGNALKFSQTVFNADNAGFSFSIYNDVVGTSSIFVKGNTNNVIIGSQTDISSAILQLTSSTKGFLPPRMTTAQKNAIVTPATGLIIYDTTLNKLCLYNSAAFETITSV